MSLWPEVVSDEIWNWAGKAGHGSHSLADFQDPLEGSHPMGRHGIHQWFFDSAGIPPECQRQYDQTSELHSMVWLGACRCIPWWGCPAAAEFWEPFGQKGGWQAVGKNFRELAVWLRQQGECWGHCSWTETGALKSIQLLYFLLVFSEKSSQFFVIWFGCAKGVKKGDFLCPKRVPKTGQKVASKNPKPKGKLLSVFKFSASSFQRPWRDDVSRGHRTVESKTQTQSWLWRIVRSRSAPQSRRQSSICWITARSKAIVLCSVICHSWSHLSMSLYCPGNICGQHQCLLMECSHPKRKSMLAEQAPLLPPSWCPPGWCAFAQKIVLYMYI